MKCIDNELIQKFIDGETGATETEWIENHRAECPQCARKIEEQRVFAEAVKREIGHWGKSPEVIPGFVAPVARKRGIHLKFKHYVYAATAACAIFLTVFLFPRHNPEKEKEIQWIYSIDGDFDSNRTVAEQEMVFIVIDSDGNVR
ncbi:MAG: hypothetical protein LBE91_06645 [Tannerella sp.]|jgi:hypothetical protein|nr:hypothetical protein [Tannerella sp.]